MIEQQIKAKSFGEDQLRPRVETYKVRGWDVENDKKDKLVGEDQLKLVEIE